MRLERLATRGVPSLVLASEADEVTPPLGAAVERVRLPADDPRCWVEDRDFGAGALRASEDERARIARDLREAVWPLLDAGRIAPVMDSEFDLADAAKAHARMESSAHVGKIVLKVAGVP